MDSNPFGGFDSVDACKSFTDMSGFFNPYGGRYPSALDSRSETQPSHYPSGFHHAMVPSLVSPYETPHKPTIGASTPKQATSDPNHTSSLGHGVPSSSSVNHVGPSHTSSFGQKFSAFPGLTDQSPSLANVINSDILSCSAKTVRRKRSRGTSGSDVCDECGDKFTMISP